MRAFVSVCLLVTLPVGLSAGPPSQPNAQIRDLKTLSLEELMQIDVTTVSRSSERRIDAPAAVSVITGEDIRRYGVDTLADALRLADSVSVARFNGGSWAVNTRGFAAITNNKMLVMIDGRSIYTQLFGGVFWEAQHVVLPDLDRIEIIRGPAGTLWGPNAVNGVINIITKPASDTQGALVRGVAGSRERGHVEARYGGRSGAQAAYRLYGVGSEFASPQLQDGTSAREDRRLRQAGGRIDIELDDEARLTVQGDANSGRMGLPDRPDIKMDGGNITVNYSRQRGADASFEILGYVDREHRDVPRQSWQSRTTYNFDGQHTIRLAPRYQVIWGGGARSTSSRTKPTELILFEPANRTIHQVHGFAQAEIAVRPDFSVTLGSRGERTTFSGFELQPAVRLKFTPQADSMIWGAISRAVRTPTRFDQDLRVLVGNVAVIRGDRDFRPEHLTAYETGARFTTRGNASIEASFFYNDYDDLRSQEATPLITLANLYDGHTTGVELAGDVQLLERWLVHASYTGQRVALAPLPGSRDTTNALLEADDPAHMFSVRSYVNLPGDFELDGFFRAVGKLRASKLPGYEELDARFAWHASDRLELAIVGRDLLHSRHAEFAGGAVERRYFQREVVFRVTWQSR
ncbi:MAG: TonB-dependent receptor [Acidobacteria bacterium]|nr:MAG: TonB-dependent receptor [Acidobacteriota bacterium]